jgi:hypothetical protein
MPVCDLPLVSKISSLNIAHQIRRQRLSRGRTRLRSTLWRQVLLCRTLLLLDPPSLRDRTLLTGFRLRRRALSARSLIGSGCLRFALRAISGLLRQIADRALRLSGPRLLTVRAFNAEIALRLASGAKPVTEGGAHGRGRAGARDVSGALSQALLLQPLTRVGREGVAAPLN